MKISIFIFLIQFLSFVKANFLESLESTLGFDTIKPNKTEIVDWSYENILCPSCELTFYIGTQWIKLYKFIYGSADDPIMDQFQGICYLLSPFAGYSPAVCSSNRLARTWITDTLESTLNEILELDDRYLCTFLFQICGQEYWKKIDVEEWINSKIINKPKPII